MSLRHLARQIVVQSLFTWDFYKQDQDRLEDFLHYNLERHKDHVTDIDFPKSTFEGIVKKQPVIDKIIIKAAPQWPIHKIAPVDRNILRLGIYEMLFSDRTDVPPRVAINEAIELGKAFGGPNTYKFISGVLGSVYEASDLKKNDTKAPKKKDDPSTYPIAKKAGAVVYAEDAQGELYLAFVHDIFGKWTLSKGGVGDGESAEDACVREIKQEIGLDITLEGSLASNEYVARHPQMGKIRKQVEYFLARSEYCLLYTSPSPRDA